MDTVSPSQFRTQTYRLPSIPNSIRFHFKIVGVLASYTNYLISSLTTFAASLKSHTNLFPITSHSRPKHPLNLPSTLAPRGNYSFLSVLTILLQTKNSVFVRKLHYYIIFFVSSLRLTTFTCGPDNTNRLS